MTTRHRSGAGAHAMISPVFGSRRGGNDFLTTATSGELCGLLEGTTMSASSHFLICRNSMGSASGGIGRSRGVMGPAPSFNFNSSQSSPRHVGGLFGSQLKAGDGVKTHGRASCKYPLKPSPGNQLLALS